MQKTFFKNENSGAKYYFLLLSFFMISQFALAQTQVKGIVNDFNGVTLPGVSILEKAANLKFLYCKIKTKKSQALSSTWGRGSLRGTSNIE